MYLSCVWKVGGFMAFIWNDIVNQESALSVTNKINSLGKEVAGFSRGGGLCILGDTMDGVELSGSSDINIPYYEVLQDDIGAANKVGDTYNIVIPTDVSLVRFYLHVRCTTSSPSPNRLDGILWSVKTTTNIAKFLTAGSLVLWTSYPISVSGGQTFQVYANSAGVADWTAGGSSSHYFGIEVLG